MTDRSRPRVAIVGAGPAGLAAALAFAQADHDVVLFERYDEIRAAGNILNLWPPPQKALAALGVDVVDLGAPSMTQLRRHDGRLRADFRIPPEIVEKYNGGFIGLIRWGLYKRMLDALPAGVLRLGHRVTSLNDLGNEVVVSFDAHPDETFDLVVGADGIESVVRRILWGDQPIRHHRLHLLGGYFLTDGEVDTRGVFAHDRTVQGSYTPIRHEGRSGYEWWVLEAWEPGEPFTADVKEHALTRVGHFAEPLPSFIRRTPDAQTHRWEIRDRVPMKQWSIGRVTLIGDAAHPTSPYAAYGAGMSIEDGYFLGRALADVDVTDTAAVRRALQGFEDKRKPHTAKVSQEAFATGRLFHRAPRWLRPLRDFVFDHTSLLQHTQGNAAPAHIMKQLGEIEDVPSAEWA